MDVSVFARVDRGSDLLLLLVDQVLALLDILGPLRAALLVVLRVRLSAYFACRPAVRPCLPCRHTGLPSPRRAAPESPPSPWLRRLTRCPRGSPSPTSEHTARPISAPMPKAQPETIQIRLRRSRFLPSQSPVLPVISLNSLTLADGISLAGFESDLHPIFLGIRCSPSRKTILASSNGASNAP